MNVTFAVVVALLAVWPFPYAKEYQMTIRCRCSGGNWDCESSKG